DNLFELLQLSSNINNQDINDHLVEEQLFYRKIWGLICTATDKCLLHQDHKFIQVIEDYLDNIHKHKEELAKISRIYQASTSNKSDKSDKSDENVKSDENDDSNKENWLVLRADQNQLAIKIIQMHLRAYEKTTQIDSLYLRASEDIVQISVVIVRNL
ncbi:4314_t:CDS:2, partial [Gigaspora margarita]